MFEGLQERLDATFRKLRGEGKISEEVLKASLREIRLALLEGDVNFKVVKAFVKRIEERALGEAVLESLTPAQQVVKIVRDELVVLLGEEGTELSRTGRPTVVLMCGLQGSGKTTTAGKLSRRLRKNGRNPLLVADAMTGQDAVSSAQEFGRRMELTGVILSKLDGDARGGAALSIRTVAQVPIRFVGVGETPDDLELFQPERMAGRITGMGDVLSLIEKAEQGLDKAESERLAGRLAKRQFTLEDLRDHLKQLKKLGPLSQVMGMLPKTGPFRGLDASDVDEDQFRVVSAIIDSMTPQERRLPKILNGSRRRRIARGSGTTVQQVNQLLKQHRQMQKMMKQMKGSWMSRIAG